MSRKLICDFCFEEFPDHDSDIDTGKTAYCENLCKGTDICSDCAFEIVRNMAGPGGYSAAALYQMMDGKFPEPPPKPPGAAEAPLFEDDDDLDLDPEDVDPDPEVEAAQKQWDASVNQLFNQNPDIKPDDVFRLTMHGAGLNPEHELLFQTLDEAKDYAVKNAQVFPQAAYALSCPDGTRLAGGPDPQWAPEKGGHVALHWKVATQPKKA